MNPIPLHNRQTEDWQRALREAIRDPRELLDMLGLSDSALAAQIDLDPTFRVRVPRGFTQLMRHADERDPLLRQVLALEQELLEHPGYRADPLAEAQASPVPGLLHKYAGRALLLSSPACAVHCRYCFRREFPYQQHADGLALASALEHLHQDQSIDEVILSGGDPLTLKDDALHALFTQLGTITQLRRVRIHTRTPVVIPQRVTPGLLALLSAQRMPIVIVLHANHANELGADFAHAALQLRATGVTLLNQSVLLNGVNDDADALCALSERLFECAVLPYYLHLLDPVRGTAHFDVPEQRGKQLIAAMRNRLPRYLVPRLAREIAGEPAKQVLAS